MRFYTITVLLLMAALSAGANAETDSSNLNLPAPYVSPARPLAGTIRIWGHGAYAGTEDFIESLTRAWEKGFRRDTIPMCSLKNATDRYGGGYRCALYLA